MFINTYIAIPLWIFGIFGFIYFALRVFDTLDYLNKKTKKFYTMIITAKNQEESIEGIVRDIAYKTRIYGAEEQFVSITLIDFNSEDKTKDILERLKDKL